MKGAKLIYSKKSYVKKYYDFKEEYPNKEILPIAKK